MKLLIDAGNTRLKWATLSASGIGPAQALDWRQLDPQCSRWDALPAVEAAYLCSVAPAAATRHVIQCCRNHQGWPLEVIHTTAHRAGVSNGYQRPQELGADRWVTLIGAHHYADGPKCVVDLGSAATIDLISADGSHQGGLIAPGYRAMTHALHAATGLAVPDAAATRAPTPQRGTVAGIQSGALQALIGLIDATHRNFQHGRSTLILTGGDAARVQPYLRAPVTAVPDLLFRGLAVLAEA